MFNPRRCCCHTDSSHGGTWVVLGLVAAVAAYLAIRSILPVLVMVAEIAGLTLACLVGLALVAAVTVALIRWHRRRLPLAPVVQLPACTEPAMPAALPAAADHLPGDQHALYAEAIAAGADRRFLNAIIATANQKVNRDA